MRAPSIRTRRILTRSSAPVAVLLAGLMVWSGSNAAFSSDTRNVGNSWETGSVALSNDSPGGVAMFQIQNVIPGQTGEKCINVTATSSVPGLVKLYTANLGLNGLQDYVKVTIVRGTGGTSTSCGTFVADTAPSSTSASQPLTSLLAAANSYTNGILPWTTAGVTAGESTSYKFDWVFDPGTTDQAVIDGLQGKSTNITFEWELQNTAT